MESLNYPVPSDNHILSKINENNSKIQIAINQLDIYKIGGDTIYGGTIFSDLNAITKNARGTCYGSAVGSPGSLYSWFIDHNNSNVGTVSAYQRAVAYSTDIIVAERTKIASTWGTWVINNISAISENLTSSNLGTVTAHTVRKKIGVVLYRLSGQCGTWTSGTSYTVATIQTGYRPFTVFDKELRLNDILFGHLTIGTSGNVSIVPRATISASNIAINETFLI